MSFYRWIHTIFKKQEPDNSMKFLIVGLGNMGAEYDHTRHNIGFEVVDHVAEEKGAIFKNDKLGDIAKIKHKGRTIILLKPSTYMNLSGKSVRYWMQKEKIPLERTVILVDDIHIDFGKIRIRKKGSDGGHNGLKSINQILGRSDYARIRIGVGNDFHKGQQVSYVLGKWSDEQSKELPAIKEKCAKAILGIATIGLDRAMNAFSS